MTDLRDQAAALRENQRPTGREQTPPEERGKRLVTLRRGEDSELRVAWDEYKGHPYLSLRMWKRDAQGQWWPDKQAGVTVRVRELPDFAEAVAAAMDEAQRPAGERQDRADAGDHGSRERAREAF